MVPHSIKQFSIKFPAFTEAALRNLIFKAETRHSTNGAIAGNGMIESGAIVRLGRRVLIDEDRFFQWVRQLNPSAWQNTSTPMALADATVAA